jgi:colanic acid/amylovoran biosynthesis glycosyltransferase
MKILLLLTALFPYDSGEEFLTEEVKHIRGFDRVLVCPCNLKESSVVTKELPDFVDCVPLRRAASSKSVYLKLMTKPYVHAEIADLIREGRFSSGRLHEMLFFMRKAQELYEALVRSKQFDSAGEVTIYSYWFYDAAAAGALLAADLRKRGVQVTQISRAHGFDIHEERAATCYLPMRRFLLSRVDRLFPCSQNGADTIIGRYPEYAAKIHPAVLGTADHGEKPGSRERGLQILSCSYMVPVKRLHLIVQALKLADFPVAWTHIGSGPLEKEIKKQAESLPENVQTHFTGQMDNATVMDYYRANPVSVFVNVSASEGIPVTVMEACSFGIPVIATDVGGTREAVTDGKNGFLLPKNFSPEQLLTMLRRLKDMPEEEYGRLCAGSRKIWEDKFNAEYNYKRFYEELSK